VPLEASWCVARIATRTRAPQSPQRSYPGGFDGLGFMRRRYLDRLSDRADAFSATESSRFPFALSHYFTESK
jgi:hypothetical protein